jgi:hypothetical protein
MKEKIETIRKQIQAEDSVPNQTFQDLLLQKQRLYLLEILDILAELDKKLERLKESQCAAERYRYDDKKKEEQGIIVDSQ